MGDSRRPTGKEDSQLRDAPWRLEGARGAESGSHGRIRGCHGAAGKPSSSPQGDDGIDGRTARFLLSRHLPLKNKEEEAMRQELKEEEENEQRML